MDSIGANHRYPFSMLNFETVRLRCRPLSLAEYVSFKAGVEPPWLDLHNPFRHLTTGPSPLSFRIPRVEANPAFAEIGLVLAIDKVSSELIGSAGFHDFPDVAPSMHIIKKLGFHFIGEQLDEIDGRELIFELSVNEFKGKGFII